MYDEKDIQAIKISRAQHFEPQSLKNYKANRAKALAEMQVQDAIPTHAIRPDVWQLISQNLDNAQKLDDMNGFLKVFLSQKDTVNI